MPIESEENLIVLVGTAHLFRILLVIILAMPDNFLVRLGRLSVFPYSSLVYDTNPLPPSIQSP
jgi:hypothetical protein